MGQPPPVFLPTYCVMSTGESVQYQLDEADRRWDRFRCEYCKSLYTEPERGAVQCPSCGAMGASQVPA